MNNNVGKEDWKEGLLKKYWGNYKGGDSMETQDLQGEVYARQVMQSYKADVEKLLPYVKPLSRLKAADATGKYTDQGIGTNSIPVPVFDANLLNFVKAAQKTKLIERNYQYVYTRNNIKTHKDEDAMIEKATYREMDLLKGILSYYVLQGNVKGSFWVEAVECGVFCKVILKMKELVEMWK